jgi:hypothetical protein
LGFVDLIVVIQDRKRGRVLVKKALNPRLLYSDEMSLTSSRTVSFSKRTLLLYVTALFTLRLSI